MLNLEFKDYLQAQYQVAEPQLGAREPLEQLGERIYRSLTGHSLQANPPQKEARSTPAAVVTSAPDPQPLVVGLYGEWGCGKTFWLEILRKQILFAQHGETGSEKSKDPLIIPVFFNAWRFEKEPHLIVPLLKLTAQQLEAWAAYQKPFKDRLTDFAKELGVSALAFACSIKGSVETNLIPGISLSLEKDEQKADTIKEAFKGRLEKIAEASSALDSLYFNLHALMQQMLTIQVAGRPLRLLYLIDDLDRCLPEKAVEMLESIKLFLEVPGTAFVLAVDDEIVERGIQHRYREYSFNSQQQAGKGQDATEEQLSTPISGHEYLEKIITLPVRLDRPPDAEVDGFIGGGQCPALMELKQAMERLAEGARSGRGELEEASASLQEDVYAGKGEPVETFEQLLRSIPKVPRKLLRLSELFGLRKAVLQTDERHWPLLFRIVAVQLLAPEIYRLVSKGGDYEFLAILHEWKSNKETGGKYWPVYDKLKAELHDTYQEKPADRTRWMRFYLPLLQALHKSSTHRSGFRLEELVTQAVVADKTLNWQSLFHRMPPLTAPQRPVAAEFVTPTKDGVTTRVLPDAERQSKRAFVRTTTPDRQPATGTQSFRASTPMTTAWEPYTIPSGEEAAFFDRMFGSAQSGRDQVLAQVGSGRRLAREHDRRLFDEFRKNFLGDKPTADATAFKTWLQEMAAILAPDALQAVAEMAGYPDFADKRWLKEQMDVKTVSDPRERLWAADILAWLGDDRGGVGVKGGVPDLDWVSIPAGSFRFGSEEEKNGPSTIEGPAFRISRYPITNAQFAGFVADGGYAEDAAWWQGLRKPEPDTSRWPHPNRPRTDVDWYEAMAFCRWLSSKVGHEVSLPAEQQWERAGRGPGGKTYPWGKAYVVGTANVDESSLNDKKKCYLEQTSAVGLYSPVGDTVDTYEGKQVADLAGNVWEWCLNQYEQADETRLGHTDAPRVLRGSSWNRGPSFARAFVRFRLRTVGRFNRVGFRVCAPPKENR
jgi:formylglycine-generating enzyme required for sulfatase activity